MSSSQFYVLLNSSSLKKKLQSITSFAFVKNKTNNPLPKETPKFVDSLFRKNDKIQ